MITCERCGNQISIATTICPVCGTALPAAQPPFADYGQRQPPSVSYEYSQGYGQQSAYQQPGVPLQPNYPPQTGYPPQPNYPPQTGYPPQPVYSQPPAPYAIPMVNVNVSTSDSGGGGSSNSGAILAEVLLSIFLGIYGVGWLMAGKTTPGIILLVCSLLLYWPTVIITTIFTFGLGLLCVGPLEVGLIILNAILLNNAIKSNAQLVVVQTAIAQQPMMQQPPIYPRQ